MIQFIILWNNKYPLDRWVRKKYNIRFNSPEHRKMNLADVIFDFKEDQMYSKITQEMNTEAKKQKNYSENGWMNEKQIKVDESLFTKIDYSLFDDDTQKDSI